MAVAGGGGGGRGKVEGRPRLPAALALPPLPPQRTWPIIESMSCPPCGRALAASRSCRVTSLVGRRGGGGAEVGRGERGGASREGGARGARGQALQPSLPTPAHARTQPQRLEASSASIGGVVCAWSGGRARTCATSRRVCTSPLGHNPPATTSFWGGGGAHLHHLPPLVHIPLGQGHVLLSLQIKLCCVGVAPTPGGSQGVAGGGRVDARMGGGAGGWAAHGAGGASRLQGGPRLPRPSNSSSCRGEGRPVPAAQGTPAHTTRPRLPPAAPAPPARTCPRA